MSDLGHKQWESQTNLPVGEILKRTRSYYNLSLREVEKNLRIRAIQLEAVEEGRYEALPGKAYAIGFIRAYAEYLGLDGDKMVHLYKSQVGNSRYRAQLNPNVPEEATESKIPNVYILGGSFAILLILLLSLAIFGGKSDRAGTEIPDVARAEAAPAEMDELIDNMPLEVAMANSVEGAVSPEQLVKPQSRIVITALDSAWLEVRDAKGKPQISRILKQGDKYLVPDMQGLVLDTGNVGVLEFAVDGIIIPPLGQPGDVKRKMPLDANKLLADSGVQVTPPPAVAAEPAAIDPAAEVPAAVVSAPAVAAEQPVAPVAEEPKPAPVKKAAPKKPKPAAEESAPQRIFFNN